MGERQERFRQTIEQLSPRPLSGMCWRQTSPRYALSSLPPRGSGGRYDRAGGSPVLYAAETRDGAWAELYRHHSGTGVDVSLMKRRFGAIHVNSLDVLDLADSNVRKAVGVFDDDLIAEDYELCQDLADAAREAGLDGLRVPSGALFRDRHNIVVFDHALGKIVAQEGKVRRPPVSQAATLPDISFRHARTFRQAVAPLTWRQRLRVVWSVLRPHR
jgi:RES domain-containing protein